MYDIKVSVIIPLAPKEKLNGKLEQQLLTFPRDWEILLCSSQQVSYLAEIEDRVIRIAAENGRANCLNVGAKYAKGEYLWFLHSDSILLDRTVNKLQETMGKQELGLYYFDLKFIIKTCYYMRFNEMGVLYRSRCLHTPFGDQAFFINRELFESLPLYSTEVPYGEDHILVRDYRRNQIPILPIGMKILTSARKYEENGWLKTNLRHLYLWRKQVREDGVKHKGDMKYENGNRNILQNTGSVTH
ncbi:MAG: glycosyltransferase [Mobilitalea sp.]